MIFAKKFLKCCLFCTFQYEDNGEFNWDTTKQGYLLSSFFYGYVITQIPFGILAKRYGSKYFLGVGMLINSLFGLLVPISAHWGFYWLMVVRFIQGLGEVSTLTTSKLENVTLFAWLINQATKTWNDNEISSWKYNCIIWFQFLVITDFLSKQNFCIYLNNLFNLK